MNFAAISVVAIIVFGSGFATDKATSAVVTSPTALLSVFAIFAAAVLVRLNRGLPSVEWKLVEDEALDNLLNAVEKIAKDYVWVLSIVMTGIIMTVILFVVGDGFVYREVKVSNSISSVTGAIFGLSISRMAHLVWLDIDIVRLQRKVVESSARQKQIENQTETASKKIDQMREALRSADFRE